MDARENLLKSIEKWLTVYANWVDQGGGIRSDGAEYLYCDLLNTAFGYELGNMNRIRDNFPAIDLGDSEERLAVQVTSTGDADKVKKTLKRFYDHKLNEDYDRLIVLIAGKAECKPSKFDHPGLELQIWGTAELLGEFRDRLSMKTLKAVDAFLQERVDAPKVKEPVLHLPVPEWRNSVEILGRERELSWIMGELEKGTKPVIVAGLGGMGKTVLTIKFRKECWKKGHAYFVRFRDTFTRTLADSVGMAIPVEERKGLNEEQTAELALSYLNRCESCDLLIVDNAEVPGAKWSDLTRDPFYEKIRRLPMAVLMTTRHRDTGGKWLGSLEQDELRQIFRGHKVSISEGEMDELIDAVDGHTMTVDMIARTIRESWGDVAPETILTAMKNSTLNEADFDEIENDHDPEQRQIYAHLKALFDLSGISEDGRQALRCATLLPQTGMDAGLFRAALTAGAAKEIKKLEKQGWVDRKDDLVLIHPVVRLVCRTELEPTDENCGAFLDKCWEQFEAEKCDHTKYWSLAELFSKAVNTLEDRQHKSANRALKIYWVLSEIQLSDGKYKVALKSGLRILELQKQVFPEEYDSLANSYSRVAMSLSFLDDHSEALKYQKKALPLWEKILSPEHPDLARYYNNIGCTYSEMRGYKEALEYQMKALRICEKVLPQDHPDLVTCYSNLGDTLCKLRYYEEGLDFRRMALQSLERTLPDSHPDLARACFLIAATYYQLRRIHKAARYMRRAAEIINRSSLPQWHRQRKEYNEWADYLEEKTNRYSPPNNVCRGDS